MRPSTGACRICGSTEWIWTDTFEAAGGSFYMCMGSHKWPGVWQPGQGPQQDQPAGSKASADEAK